MNQLSHFIEERHQNEAGNHLVFQNHNIEEIDELFMDMSNIRSLDLSSNKLKTLKGIHQFTDLRSLNISHNKIIDVSELFHLKDLANLQTLNLKDNPVVKQQSYKLTLMTILPHLQTLDGVKLTQEDLQENNRTVKYMNTKLNIIYENYLSIVELQSIIQKLLAHKEYILTFEPHIVNPPFNLQKFRKTFSFGDTLDEQARQEIKTNLLGDIQTIQNQILKTSNIQEAFEEMEKRQLERIQQLQEIVFKRVKEYRYNCLDIEIFHKLNQNCKRIQALKRVINFSRHECKNNEVVTQRSANKNQQRNIYVEDNKSNYSAQQRNNKPLQEINTEESLRGSFENQTFTEKDLKRLANINSNLKLNSIIKQIQIFTKKGDYSESNISEMNVKNMSEEEKELLIEKLAGSLKKYIGKSKEIEKQYEKVQIQHSIDQDSLKKKEEELTCILEHQEQIKQKLESFGANNIEECFQTLQESLEQIKDYRMVLEQQQQEESSLMIADQYYEKKLQKRILGQLLFQTKKSRMVNTVVASSNKYRNLKLLKIYLAHWKQYNVFNKIKKTKCVDQLQRNYVACFFSLKFNVNNVKIQRKFKQKIDKQLMEKAFRCFFIVREQKKQEKDKQEVAIQQYQHFLIKKAFQSIFINHLQHSNRRDPLYEQKLQIAQDCYEKQIYLRVLSQFRDMCENQKYNKKKVIAMTQRIKWAMLKCNFRHLKLEVIRMQKMEQRADKFMCRRQKYWLRESFNIWKVDFHNYLYDKEQRLVKANLFYLQSLFNIFKKGYLLSQQQTFSIEKYNERKDLLLYSQFFALMKKYVKNQKRRKYFKLNLLKKQMQSQVKLSFNAMKVHTQLSKEKKLCEKKVKIILFSRVITNMRQIQNNKQVLKLKMKKIMKINESQKIFLLKQALQNWSKAAKKDAKLEKTLRYYEKHQAQKEGFKFLLKLLQNECKQKNQLNLEVEEKNNQFYKENEQLKDQLIEQQKQIYQANAELQQEQIKTQQLTKYGIEKDVLLQQLIKQNNELKEINIQLTEVAEKREINNQNLESNLNIVQDEYENQIQNLQNINEQLIQERIELNNTIQSFNVELKGKVDEINDLKSMTAAKNEDFYNELTLQKNQILSYEKIIAEYEEMALNLTSKNKEVESLNVHLNVRVDSLQDRITTMQNDHTNQIAQLEKQLEFVNREKSNLIAQNTLLMNENKTFQSELNTLHQNLKKEEYKVSLLREQDYDRTTQYINKAKSVLSPLNIQYFSYNKDQQKHNSPLQIARKLNSLPEDSLIERQSIHHKILNSSHSRINTIIPEKTLFTQPHNQENQYANYSSMSQIFSPRLNTNEISKPTIKKEVSPLREYLTDMKYRASVFIKTLEMDEKNQQSIRNSPAKNQRSPQKSQSPQKMGSIQYSKSNSKMKDDIQRRLNNLDYKFTTDIKKF